MAVTTEKEAFARGAAAARAGKSIFSNPFLKMRASDWMRGYNSVPEAERGSTGSDAETGPPLPTTNGLARRTMAKHPHVNQCFRNTGDILPHDWRGGTGQR